MVRERQRQRQRVNLRPTLVIGLGGAGTRIAVHLKARLDEIFAGANDDDEASYKRIIKFLSFDTASEEMTAPQPNNPDVTVRLEPASEVMRISDISLNELMGSREANRAIGAILPQILHTTQIDQGAQQVRRLGRIALFRHFEPVRKKLHETITQLHLINQRGRIGVNDEYEFHVVDRNRLRVFILCSICGGTGSGTFLDMAYLTRYLADEVGITAARNVDVVGMLMLPEAFPEIRTTGAARIRANAYGALLDLEYYNQPAEANTELYQVDFPGETVSVAGPPFSLCYLVSGSGKPGTLDGMTRIAPVLAEALYTMVATPLGERLDATLDNVRGSLATYFNNYKAFYSAIGISQLVYPKLWLRQQYMDALQRHIIKDRILFDDKRTVSADELPFENYRDDINKEIDRNLPDPEDVTRPLQGFMQAAATSTALISELQSAYRASLRLHRQRVTTQAKNEQERVTEMFRNRLLQDISAHIDGGLLDTDDKIRGFHWTLRWLKELETAIADDMQLSTRRSRTADPNIVLNQQISLINDAGTVIVLGNVLGRSRAMRAAGQLAQFINLDLRQAALTQVQVEVFNELLNVIGQQRQAISAAIDAWQSILDGLNRENTRAQLPLVTRSVLEDEAIEDEVQKLVQSALANKNVVYTTLNARFTSGNDDTLIAPDGTTILRGLSRSLDAIQLSELRTQLVAFATDSYNRSRWQFNVIETLMNIDGAERRNLLRNLGDTARPLLSYRADMIQSMSPRLIKILGASTEVQAKMLIEQGVSNLVDVSPLSNNDPSTVTFLETHHGIPIAALSRLEEYRRHYVRLRDDPTGIFHLDPERELLPYDPGSYYFVNAESFEMMFARALAYGWVRPLFNLPLPPPNALITSVNGQSASDVDSAQETHDDAASQILKTVYVMSEEFYDAFKQASDMERQRLSDQFEGARQHYREHRGNLYEMGRASVDGELIRRQQKELEDHLHLYHSVTSIDEAYLIDMGKAQKFYPLPFDSGQLARRYAQTLSEALSILYGGDLRIIPNRFEAAFKQAYDTFKKRGDEPALDEMLRRFLKARRYPLSAEFSTTHNAGQDARTQMLWTTPDQPDYALEKRLCALLLIYHRLITDEDRNRERLPMGYLLTAADSKLWKDDND